MNEIERIEESSQYLATLLRRNPDYSDWLLNGKNLYRKFPLTELYQDLQHKARQAGSFAELQQGFREFKQRHFLRIGGRDLLGKADLAETTAQLSDLASVALQVGLEALSGHPQWWIEAGEVDEWPAVRESFQLVVMGMGKLGGQELNYVSDIDLLFLYSPAQSVSASGPAEVAVLLNRLCQRLSGLLADAVEGDRVFQVDLRLRPQGKDGPLVPPLFAAAEYYLNSGHAWERQVLLKARPVAGVRPLGSAFLQEVRPFIFRRFLDFQALDELRAMRDRILAEAVRPRSGWQQFDVKLGIGGIREIEFLVQSLQLIYGGRHPELDEPNTLRCLKRLGDLDLLAAKSLSELKQSYTFLRRVEHWVQLDQNRQTQKLPRDEKARKRLALALGFEGDERKFLEQLEACCTTVHEHFAALFETSGGGEAAPAPADEPEAGGLAGLSSLKHFPAEPLERLESDLSAYSPALRQTVRGILNEVAGLRESELQEKVLVRLDRYFSQVRKRPGLMKVFFSPAVWIGAFCRGIAQSELLSDLLSHHPSLVEGLATGAGGCPNAKAWEKASERVLERAESYEEGLEWIRRLKNERVLQLALADLRGIIDHGLLEEELSSLADFVIRNTYMRVLRSLGLDAQVPLSVLGLGKLGSREMSYLSDLDVMFVYQPRAGESGDQIPENVIRLIQRFMRMLSTPLQEGPGYAVDARLRPTGNYGPLIVTRKAWYEYYSEKADLWEIQALLRIRSVAGNTDLNGWIEGKARELCFQKRNPNEVWQRICHLRHRMQRERSEEKSGTVDLKLGMGGLADLEFFVQGCQMTEGYANPSLQGRSVRSGLGEVVRSRPDVGVSAEDVRSWYEALRALDHRMRLHTNQATSRLSTEQFDSLQAMGLWPPLHAQDLVEEWQDLLRIRRRVRALLQHFCPEL